jgi:hypothetical protein
MINNISYNPKDVIIPIRNDTNTNYIEAHISGSQLIIYLDELGNLNADNSQSFYQKFPPSATPAIGSVSQIYENTFDDPNAYGLIPSNSFQANIYHQDGNTSSFWTWDNIHFNWWTANCSTPCPACFCCNYDNYLTNYRGTSSFTQSCGGCCDEFYNLTTIGNYMLISADAFVCFGLPIPNGSPPCVSGYPLGSGSFTCSGSLYAYIQDDPTKWCSPSIGITLDYAPYLLYKVT